ncbi:MAG: biopolymer transporter ExbD [Acidobacteria bacterium]|nr:biopolymer transporter ExbD [Acidobacteriota bacterium]
MPKVEPVSSGGGRGRRARGQRVSTSLAEINVVPLVDVMLVLLIIFMVSAPMMQQGFSVRLPQSRRPQPISAEPVYVTVPLSFLKDSTVLLDKERIGIRFLAERVSQELKDRPTQDVYVGGDGQITLQALITVMDRLKSGGVDRVMIATSPPDGRRAP